MAYNPALYNPYGLQTQQVQPTNGLVWIDGIEGAQMNQMAPDSVSPPLFLKEEDSIIIKTTDGGGAASLKKYSFSEVPLQQNDSELYVTKEYFDAKIGEITEAINGKHIASEQSDPDGE